MQKLKGIIIAAGRGTRLGKMTKTLPKCLLEINGKPILEYQVNALRANGINEIAIIKGHQAGKIDFPELITYYNDDYLNNNILCSLMCAADAMHDGYIASYSDIIYAPKVVEKLLKSLHPISVVVDTDWMGKYTDRTLHPISEAEKVHIDENGFVKQFGKILPEVSERGKIFEFIGLFKCTPEGAEIFKRAFFDIKQKLGLDKPFKNAPTFRQAYITDMLNYLIEHGIEVHYVPIQKDWREIDTQQDLDQARKWFKERFITRNYIY